MKRRSWPRLPKSSDGAYSGRLPEKRKGTRVERYHQEIKIMLRRADVRPLNRARILFAIFFIPVVVLHFAWITPVVEWSCFCPEDEPNHQCCCNCPKCVKNRGGFKSFCHLRPVEVEETGIDEGACSISDQGNATQACSSHSRSEIMTCQCDSHIKKITLDIKPILPSFWTHIVPLPVVKIISTDDRRPPEAIPCPPHRPG